jgi:hypothetical protein
MQGRANPHRHTLSDRNRAFDENRREVGVRPFLRGIVLWVFVAAGSLLLIRGGWIHLQGAEAFTWLEPGLPAAVVDFVYAGSSRFSAIQTHGLCSRLVPAGIRICDGGQADLLRSS